MPTRDRVLLILPDGQRLVTTKAQDQYFLEDLEGNHTKLTLQQVTQLWITHGESRVDVILHDADLDRMLQSSWTGGPGRDGDETDGGAYSSDPDAAEEAEEACETDEADEAGVATTAARRSKAQPLGADDLSWQKELMRRLGISEENIAKAIQTEGRWRSKKGKR